MRKQVLLAGITFFGFLSYIDTTRWDEPDWQEDAIPSQTTITPSSQPSAVSPASTPEVPSHTDLDIIQTA